MGTVYLEAYDSGWRTEGPMAMRSTGEVEMIVAQSRHPFASAMGPCQVAAGIVSNVDLTQGDAVADILEAHRLAGQGRLRGVRHHVTYDAGAAGRFVYNQPPDLMANPEFRKGLACVQRAGLCFDVFIFHTQLEQLAELAGLFPGITFVVNHVGTRIHVAEYEGRRAEVLDQWERGMRALARLSNVRVKIGGLGMPIFGFGFEWAQAPAGSAELVTAWQPIIDACIEWFGAERCLFESNFPVDKQSCGYVELWNAYKLATRARSPQERRDLFYRTACRTYRLPELEQACDHAVSEQA